MADQTRTSQEYVEVVGQLADNVRTTQEYVEVVQRSADQARVAQEYIEVVLIASNINTETTQEYVEVVQAAGTPVLPNPTPPVGTIPETPPGPLEVDTDVWASF